MQSRFHRMIDQRLNVREVGDIIEQGVTFPARCHLSEGINGIVKYPKNPAGSCALINEWVGNAVADVIGLSIPEYGNCYLSEDVIESTNKNEEIDYRNAGLCFFSVQISNTARTNRHVLLKTTTRETERLLLFDHLIDNEDRHIGNLLYEVSRSKKVLFIDCSHIMVPSSHRLDDPIDLERSLSDEAILDPHLLEREDDNIYNMLCETMGYKEEVLYLERDRVRERLDTSALREIRESIPNEWVNDSTTQRINDMFLILEARIHRIDDISDMIAQERRKRQWRKY